MQICARVRNACASHEVTVDADHNPKSLQVAEVHNTLRSGVEVKFERGQAVYEPRGCPSAHGVTDMQYRRDACPAFRPSYTAP